MAEGVDGDGEGVPVSDAGAATTSITGRPSVRAAAIADADV